MERIRVTRTARTPRTARMRRVTRAAAAACAALTITTGAGGLIPAGLNPLSPPPAHAGPGTDLGAIRADSGENGPFRTVGRWVVDGSGKVVIPHGENIANKRAPYTVDALGVTEEDAAFLASHGFNSVRLAVLWVGVEPTPGTYDDAYLSNVKKTVEMFHRHGMSTVVEFHQDAWSEKYNGDGAPEWASIDDGFYNTNAGILGAGTNPANNQAIQNFFANRPAPDGKGIKDHFVEMWGHTAGYLAGTNGLAGYGIINEPHEGWPYLLCQLNICPPGTTKQLEDLYKDTGKAIRREDASTPVVYSGYLTTIFGTPPNLGEPPVDNAMYNYNTYCLALDAWPQVPLPFCDPQINATAEQSRLYAEKYDIPRVITEFGATTRADVLQRQTDEARKQRIGWYHWAYMGIDPATAASNPEDQAIVKDPRKPIEGDNVQWGTLAALEEPYPQSVAGTPETWNYDRGSQTFTARWSPQRVDGTGSFTTTDATTIWVPEANYGSDYVVEVSGGRVVSAPGARKLLVVSDGSGTPVSVTVRPKNPPAPALPPVPGSSALPGS
ncbi:hypothetical protein DLJ54_07120 [Corynebacterium heidelbergense]|uniref:Endoglycoceramidase n=1 Tax=Corynebacterium heidelbergense TaxID=2055947 RepID=A0A364V4W5_9CORY|nr:hypothetical protein DLJ54_07120 [Corynebacterium heidelbergense]